MDQEVQELASQSQYNQNNNCGGNVKDMSYYELLHVPATAVPKEIKRAYYRQARDVHPDKNKGSEEAAEKFRKLHMAYVTLSDEDKRAKYDKYGITNQQEDGGSSNPLEFEPYVFYAVMFSSQLVEPYIGELTIASFTDQILHLAQGGKE
jgi:DnaJ-class molecular chaperone